MCEANAYYSKDTNKCECKDNYLSISDGLCVKKTLGCPTRNEFFNITTNECQCNQNYSRKNNNLSNPCILNVACPTGYVNIKEVCVKINWGTSRTRT